MKNDESRLLDILIAARRIDSYLSNMSKDDFLASFLYQDAVIRGLEVIGEAASKLSSATKDKLESIPWFEIIAMRNRLIHEYFRIDMERIWLTAKDDIPSLIREIEKFPL